MKKSLTRDEIAEIAEHTKWFSENLSKIIETVEAFNINWENNDYLDLCSEPGRKIKSEFVMALKILTREIWREIENCSHN